MNGIAYHARITLIDIGKMLPFIICFVVAISHAECLYALLAEDYVVFQGDVYLNKPISWFLGSFFEYDKQILLIATILSFAVKTCKWNKIAILYLGFQLIEKNYFATHQWDNENKYCIVAAINITICLFLVFKGIKNL